MISALTDDVTALMSVFTVLQALGCALWVAHSWGEWHEARVLRDEVAQHYRRERLSVLAPHIVEAAMVLRAAEERRAELH